jgi:NAD(P)-dependent dehydrogenase (short-subunit alcohol dehydrogenase family)
MGSLDGKHALVTGGTRGIGLAVAQALQQAGARVTITGREQASLDGAEFDGAKIVLDVADPESVAQAFAHAGQVDILINNAGQAASSPFHRTDAETWQRMLDVNLSGTFHCTRAALPGMVEAGWGRVVNIASTAGLTGYRYVAAYCAAKHGVIGLTRALALEVATRGVTVNAVCPGFTETDIVKDAVSNIMAKTGRTEDQARADLAAGNPQQRLIQPEEVASAVVWLCQPASGSMNGQAIAVAGGEVL